jgi:hypothetical protein
MGVKAEFDKEILIELDKKQAEFDRQLDAERKKLADSVSIKKHTENTQKTHRKHIENT